MQTSLKTKLKWSWKRRHCILIFFQAYQQVSLSRSDTFISRNQGSQFAFKISTCISFLVWKSYPVDMFYFQRIFRNDLSACTPMALFKTRGSWSLSLKTQHLQRTPCSWNPKIQKIKEHSIMFPFFFLPQQWIYIIGSKSVRKLPDVTILYPKKKQNVNME